MPRQATKREIRDHLGHGRGNCRVRIARDAKVTAYGSTDSYDRGRDYWRDEGWEEQYKWSGERVHPDAEPRGVYII